jgi:hypothetical protein
LVQRLDPPAVNILTSLTPEERNDYNTLCKKLDERFRPQLVGVALARHVENIHMTPGQDIIDFNTKFSQAMAILPIWAGLNSPTEAVKRVRYFRALLKNFQDHLCNRFTMVRDETENVWVPDITFEKMLTECEAYAQLQKMQKEDREAFKAANPSQGQEQTKGKGQPPAKAGSKWPPKENKSPATDPNRLGKNQERGECFNCGKKGHMAFDCRAPKNAYLQKPAAPVPPKAASPAPPVKQEAKGDSKETQKPLNRNQKRAQARRAKAEQKEDDSATTGVDVESELEKLNNTAYPSATRIMAKQDFRMGAHTTQ